MKSWLDGGVGECKRTGWGRWGGGINPTPFGALSVWGFGTCHAETGSVRRVGNLDSC